MVTLELLEFVKKHIHKQTPKEDVVETLAFHGGWKMEDINHAFLLAEHGTMLNDNNFLE